MLACFRAVASSYDRGRILGLVGGISRSGSAAVLVADSLSPGHRGDTRHSQMAAWLGTAGVVLAAAAFAGWVAVTQGRQTALEFVAGYTIEASLSVDNLFVFLVPFEGFLNQPPTLQHTALLWGVWGRLLYCAEWVIAAGIALMHRLEWVNWVFGAFLLYGAWRLMRSGSAARGGSWNRIVRLQPAKGSAAAL